MSFQSVNPELTAKILFLANLQRNLMQNQHMTNEKLKERSTPLSNTIQQQHHSIHPLLKPSLNVSSQKISAMLTALTPPTVTDSPKMSTNVIQSTACNNNNSAMNMRSNGSSFGWGNRERKMEDNWRMQNRNI